MNTLKSIFIYWIFTLKIIHIYFRNSRKNRKEEKKRYRYLKIITIHLLAYSPRLYLYACIHVFFLYHAVHSFLTCMFFFFSLTMYSMYAFHVLKYFSLHDFWCPCDSTARKSTAYVTNPTRKRHQCHKCSIFHHFRKIGHYSY